jgi:hypothetical protein
MTSTTSPIGEKQTLAQSGTDLIREEQTSTRTGVNYGESHSSTKVKRKSEVTPVARKELNRPQTRKTRIQAEDITSEMSSSIISPRSPRSPKSPRSPRSPRPKQHSIEMKPRRLQQRVDTSAPDENENLRKKAFELIPRNFKAENFVNPELRKLKFSNIEEYIHYSHLFIQAVQKPSLENQLVTDEQIKEIEIARKNMVFSADNIVELFSKNKKIDFLYDLTGVIQKSELLKAKIGPLLEGINSRLRALLLIDFDNCRHDPLVKELLGLHKNDPLFSGIGSGTSGDLERRKREITILYKYRKAMLELAKNLEAFGKNSILPEPNNQKKLLDKIEEHLDKIFQTIVSHDKEGIELKKVLSEADEWGTYKRIIYTSIATVIKARVIDDFWVQAYQKTEIELIRLRSKELKSGQHRSAFFYDASLDEFNKSLSSLKCDGDFLLWLRRMGGAGMAEYLDEKRIPILESREIPEPDNPTKVELEKYNEELEKYDNESMELLSGKAFDGDRTYLPNFLKASVELIQEWMPQLLKKDNKSASMDALERHATIFNFLGIVQKPTHEYAPLIKKMLEDFDEKLISTNKGTINKLEEKAKLKRQDDLGVEMTIQFMQRFYQAFNYRKIMTPFSNLIELYQLMYPGHGRIIKTPKLFFENSEKNSLREEATKRIYFILKQTSFEIQSVRVDILDPGLGIDEDETWCKIFTCTSVSEPYPGDTASYENAIEFSYQLVKPQTSRSPEQIKEIEDAIEERIMLLRLLIDAAGFPPFIERF